MNELREAVLAMERGEAETALPTLTAALVVPELQPGIRARVMGLRAQALLMTGQLEEAKKQVREALKAVRTLGDTRGLEQLRGLNGQIYAALAQAAQQARLHDEERAAMALSLEELLAQAPDDAARAMVFVRRSTFLADEGDDEAALEAALEGLRRSQSSGGPREKVLSLLALARLQRHRAEDLLREAEQVADDAEEAQLIAAIARAARAEGIVL